MNDKLGEYVKKHYPDSKSDMFAVFIERCDQMIVPQYFQGMVTQHAWMFLSSYEKLRDKMYQTIINMAHLGPRAFDEINGEVVQTTTFVMRKISIPEYKGTYCRLLEAGNEQGKADLFLTGKNRFITSQDSFSKIPGSPVAYWVSEKMFKAILAPRMVKYANANNGFTTGDNNLFLRLWYEVHCDCISFNSKSLQEAELSQKRWFPYNKGGVFRRWYGNNEYLINWFKNGKELKEYGHLVPRSLKFQFRQSISWGKISSSIVSFRYKPLGTMFDVGGLSLFPNDEKDFFYFLGLCNSCLTQEILRILSPTLNYETGHISAIPVIIPGINQKAIIDNLVQDNIALSRTDWDSFETSWDFRRHPLIRPVGQVAEAFRQWETECNDRFEKLKANEEELNRIFIGIYGLEGELSPEVEDRDVTVRRADLARDIRSLISYAVGCMFGRYSLDEPGLINAGTPLEPARYTSFPVNRDGILPICDDAYFEDDITGRFIEFLRVVYGPDTLEENLQFISAALGGKGDARQVIRNYFLNDFWVDHCKIYQKRPIYWLCDSGKKAGFRALIYIHRYVRDTIARLRTDYVHELQSRYRTPLLDLENRIGKATATTERIRLEKQYAQKTAQAKEIHSYEEKVHHLADSMIPIDLDDGVKHNYAIFQDILAKIN